MHKFRHFKHGYWKHPLYRIWSGMKHRCLNPNAPEYKNYGGAGIKVSPAWIDDAGKFIAWAISNGWKKGLHIDRINPFGDYSEDNCRLVTPRVNANNKRTTARYWYRNNWLTAYELFTRYACAVDWKTFRNRLEGRNMNEPWGVHKSLKTPYRRQLMRKSG